MSYGSPDDSALPILSRGNFHGRAVLAIDAQHAFNPAHHSAHRATDHRADRAGTPITLVDSIGDASRHALSLCGKRNRSNSNRGARKKNSELHQVVLPCVEAADLALKKMAIRRQGTR
jgi:hypothetical protein